jgi:hypothetical protein
VGAQLNPPRYPPPPARELRAFGVCVTLTVHKHKRLGPDIDLATRGGAERKGPVKWHAH